jgi:hypothetical protein
MKSIGNTVDIMQILVVSIFTKKGEIKKFLFIYLIPMALHEFRTFVLFAEIRLRPPGARFNKFINFSAR